MKRQVVSSLDDLNRLEAEILRSVETTIGLLRSILQSTDALAAFARLKFTEAGVDPLDVGRPLNFVEQLNQTFTYLASTRAARWLMLHHPECAPLVLNLGTTPGFDIESQCGKFVAETFAVTHPGSNDKLRKDALKMQAAKGSHRFVFYLSPVAGPRLDVPGVTLVRLEHAVISGLASADT